MPLLPPRRLNVDPRPLVDPTDYPPELAHAHAHAHGTDDPVYAARPAPRHQAALGPLARRRFAGDQWVPEGFHAGIHFEHAPLESAGSYAIGGRQSFLHHITVSPPDVIDAMFGVLRDKRAAPHLILGFRKGLLRPVCIQCIPFNLAGRALEHPGGPETNRAGVLVQMEICADVGDVPHFDEWGLYKAIANVIRVTNETLNANVPSSLARSFANTTRFGGTEFTQVNGHCGHIHVPQNTHFDPTTAYQGTTLMSRLDQLGWGDYYDLSGVGPT